MMSPEVDKKAQSLNDTLPPPSRPGRTTYIVFVVAVIGVALILNGTAIKAYFGL
jgi:hypothetical protein